MQLLWISKTRFEIHSGSQKSFSRHTSALDTLLKRDGRSAPPPTAAGGYPPGWAGRADYEARMAAETARVAAEQEELAIVMAISASEAAAQAPAPAIEDNSQFLRHGFLETGQQTFANFEFQRTDQRQSEKTCGSKAWCYVNFLHNVTHYFERISFCCDR